jgi:hypothetical protein
MLSDDLLLKIAAVADLPTAFALYCTCRRLYAHWPEHERRLCYEDWRREAPRYAIRWCRHKFAVEIKNPTVIVQADRSADEHFGCECYNKCLNIHPKESDIVIILGNYHHVRISAKNSTMLIVINVNAQYLEGKDLIIAHSSTLSGISSAKALLYYCTLHRAYFESNCLELYYCAIRNVLRYTIFYALLAEDVNITMVNCSFPVPEFEVDYEYKIFNYKLTLINCRFNQIKYDDNYILNTSSDIQMKRLNIVVVPP